MRIIYGIDAHSVAEMEKNYRIQQKLITDAICRSLIKQKNRKEY